VDEFDYFMVRIRRSRTADGSPGLAGTAERIGTGQKLAFSSGAELIGFLEPVPAPAPKMQPPVLPSKEIR
jgi:hypothetical protein